MEEDRQPNERRLQRKGDHGVPRVQSSAAQKCLQPKKSLRKKSRAKKSTPRVHNTGSVGILGGPLGERGSSGGQRLPPPPLRDLGPTRDESAAHRRPAMASVSIHSVSGNPTIKLTKP